MELWSRQRGGLEEIIRIGSLSIMEKALGFLKAFNVSSLWTVSPSVTSRSLLTLEVVTAVVTYCCQFLKKKKRKRESQRLKQTAATALDLAYSERKKGKPQEILPIYCSHLLKDRFWLFYHGYFRFLVI